MECLIDKFTIAFSKQSTVIKRKSGLHFSFLFSKWKGFEL